MLTHVLFSDFIGIAVNECVCWTLFYVSEIAGEFHGHLGVGWILIEKKEGRNCS